MGVYVFQKFHIVFYLLKYCLNEQYIYVYGSMVDLTPSKFVIGYKWVYKIKTRFDGSVEYYKARLVAKGFTLEYGFDYEEAFAPIAQLPIVCTLIAFAAMRH